MVKLDTLVSKEAGSREEGSDLSKVDEKHVRAIRRKLENRSVENPMTVEEAMDQLEGELGNKLSLIHI